jgi:NTP pyrophosphatase (non-canonical NTP hydrolase)
MNINEWSKEIHKNAVEHGWWEEERSFGEIIALCHSELSEALEEYRNANDRIRSLPIYYSGGGYIANEPTACSKKPEGIAIELADCIIRILDYCGKEEIDIEEAIKIKHEYNKTRPYRHGGKKI